MWRVGAFVTVGGLIAITAPGQDLAPRAYFITPVGSNAITLVYSFNQGAAFVDPTLPVDNPKVRFQSQAISYYRSFGFLGRTSNVSVALPYASGNLEATAGDVSARLYRSGLADGRVRFAMNLRGGPALTPKQYLSWHEKSTIGASLTILVPTGQYDPARLVNNGGNRWGFKPELAFSQRWGRWMLDLYGGAWFFTPNRAYYPGTRERGQAPIGSGELHFGRYVTPRLWISFDANFWTGGRSRVDGLARNDQERNSRVGGTVSIPITRAQALKFSYSEGAYVRIGGDFKSVAAAWQYSWVEKRE
jgi:outer membrane putative beta-barrel porin/alpha-amylase